MSSILVGNIMSKDVISSNPETPIAEVVNLMRQRNYSCLVITEQGRPLGIITERDILKLANLLLSGADAASLKAGAIMTQPIISIRNSATLTEAMAICKHKKIRHLPVINANGNLMGILTQSDLITGFLQTIEQQSIDTVTEQALHTNDDIGDGIPDVDLDDVERDLKNIFEAMHTSKNPKGADRLQSRFI